MLRITLFKYISKEIWSVFLTCLIVFIVIIMAAKLLDMIGLMVHYGVGFGKLFTLILCYIPKAIIYAMPAACLSAVLLSFIRMASDNEIIALHSSGISLFQLMSPVVVFSLICFLFAGFLTLFWTPYGNRTSATFLTKYAKSGLLSRIKERDFIERDGIIFYASNKSPKDKIFKDVFIVVEREGEEGVVIAKKMKLKPNDKGMAVNLIDAISVSEEKDGISSLLTGDFSYTIKSSILASSENSEIKPKEMYLTELLDLIKKPEEDINKKIDAKIKLHQMFSFPLAVFIIGIAGAPLGAHIRAHGRTKGIIISLVLFLFYNIVLMLSEYLCENGMIIPGIGVWLPDLFLLIICIFLLARSAGKLSLGFLDRSRLFMIN